MSMAATPDLQPTALLALDWGTSSLRGARIDATGRVMDERAFPRGILTVPAGGFAEAKTASTVFWTSGSMPVAKLISSREAFSP